MYILVCITKASLHRKSISGIYVFQLLLTTSFEGQLLKIKFWITMYVLRHVQCARISCSGFLAIQFIFGRTFACGPRHGTNWKIWKFAIALSRFMFFKFEFVSFSIWFISHYFFFIVNDMRLVFNMCIIRPWSNIWYWTPSSITTRNLQCFIVIKFTWVLWFHLNSL